MKEKVKKILDPQISKFSCFIDDVYIEKKENRPILNIVVDSDNVIDLDLITEVSRVINEKLDKENIIEEDFDELDIFSKSKGEDINE